MKSIKIVLTMLLLMSATVLAQKEDYTKEPGYINFSDLLSLKSGDLVTEMFIEEPLLKMVAKMAESQKEGISKVLGALKLVSVNEFMVEENAGEQIKSKLETLDKTLQGKNWTRIIRTKTHGRMANVYVKPGQGDSYVGLAVTSIDKSGKVSLVDIVGKIDLETIGEIATKFNIPAMDTLRDGKK